MSEKTQHEASAERKGSDVSERHLTFRLGEESYGLAVLKIREIIRIQKITPVPHMPPHMRGVINLRGKVIPVLDMRARFGLPAETVDERTCIVVVQLAETASRQFQLMGLIVDAVEEVLTIPHADIEEAPHFGSRVDTQCILGIAKVKGEVKTLLDIDLVVGDSSLAAVA